ncbi:MAG TPA: hypothetical protein DCP31_28960 [Cyanobacteria bacterium UBA8543]|nr:hypothetical protein [Cyanobacteria bacterium UBA8543]
MKLIYRALIFDYTPRSIQTYQKPRALNWRFQPAGEQVECLPRPIPTYRKPCAINWRFQPPIVSNTSQASRSLT